MGVFRRRRDIGMAEGFLDQLQIASRAEKLGREVVAQVMEMEIGGQFGAALRPRPAPKRFEAARGDRPRRAARI